MAAYRTSSPRLALLGAASLVLSACSSPPQVQPTRYDDLPSGRFVIVWLTGTQDAIQLDTASGKTWRLTWSTDEDGNTTPSGWTTLDGKDFPVR